MMAESESKPRSDGLPSVPSSVRVLHPTIAHLAQGAYKRWVQGVEQALGALITKHNLRGGREMLFSAWKMFRGPHTSRPISGAGRGRLKVWAWADLGGPSPEGESWRQAGMEKNQITEIAVVYPVSSFSLII